MHFLLKMGIFQPAMLVYQRVPRSCTTDMCLREASKTTSFQMLSLRSLAQIRPRWWGRGEVPLDLRGLEKTTSFLAMPEADRNRFWLVLIVMSIHEQKMGHFPTN